MQDLENAEYFCPDCKSKRKKTLAVAQVSMSNSSEWVISFFLKPTDVWLFNTVIYKNASS
jgi:hypothetical protein